MKFYARVNPESVTHAAWRRDGRPFWWIAGVEFQWNEQKKVYETKTELPTAAVERLKDSTEIILETHSSVLITTTSDPVTGTMLSETSREM